MAYLKKYPQLTTIFLLGLGLAMALSVPVNYAGPAVPPLAPVAPTPAADAAARIGIVAGVHGPVNIAKTGVVGQVAESGMPVFLGDEVSTGPEGTLQILLLDETVFKIGPNSAIVIDKFVYDPETQNGQVEAKVVKGVFRFVTGKIARKQPSQMKVDLPVGTIGIRGTIVAGEANPTNSLIILLGPGEKNNTENRNGRIIVGSGDEEVVINRTGFGTEISGPGLGPTPPFQISDEDLARILGALGDQPSGKEGGEEGDGESATEQSGQDKADSASAIRALFARIFFFLRLEQQEASDVLQDQSSPGTFNNVPDGLATYAQLRLVSSGQYHFSKSAIPLKNTSTQAQNGTYDITVDVDFGARSVGGGNSLVTINGNSDVANGATIALGNRSFATNNLPAIFSFGANLGGPNCSSSSCSSFVDVRLNNAGGEVAQNADSLLFINNPNNSTSYSGIGNASRSNGLS